MKAGRPAAWLRVESHSILAKIRRDLTADQGEEGPQSLSVAGGGVELDSGGKHSRCMEASKALCLAFSSLSCSVSLLICSISLLKANIRVSKSGSRRQLSIDKNCRQRGNDEKDAPLLLEVEAAAEGGEVVIRSEQSDEAKDQASDGLEPTKPIKA